MHIEIPSRCSNQEDELKDKTIREFLFPSKRLRSRPSVGANHGYW